MASLAPSHCCVCDHERLSADPFYYDWEGRRYVIYRCLRCSHQFVYPPVRREEQNAIYGDSYFSKEGDWSCGIFPGGYTESAPQLEEEAREVLDMLPVTTGHLLDIGCAGGVFLNEARARGFLVRGLELNESMAAHARNTYKLDVLNSPIEDVPMEEWTEQFDVITLMDCLEHLPQPLDLFKKIQKWMRPTGIVFIRGPLSNSVLSRFTEGIRRVIRLEKRLPGYPLDANMFNKKSLTSLLTITGFQRPIWINEAKDFANVVARMKG